MKTKWNDLSEEHYYHNLHFIHGLAKKYDELCHDAADQLMKRMSKKEKELALKHYMFTEAREGCPKDLFIFLEMNGLGHLIEKNSITFEEFSQ